MPFVEASPRRGTSNPVLSCSSETVAGLLSGPSAVLARARFEMGCASELLVQQVGHVRAPLLADDGVELQEVVAGRGPYAVVSVDPTDVPATTRARGHADGNGHFLTPPKPQLAQRPDLEAPRAPQPADIEQADRGGSRRRGGWAQAAPAGVPEEWWDALTGDFGQDADAPWSVNRGNLVKSNGCIITIISTWVWIIRVLSR